MVLKATSVSFVALMMAGMPAPAFAQDNEEAEASETRGSNTIIVTAQRREQTLQEVPLAVSVLTGEDLDRAYINDVEDIVELAPSLTITQGNNDRNSALRIRGVGTQVFSVSVEPSVSTVIDGVVLTRPGAAFSDLVDIERIEVLRGPQGTLFGKNATAGVLNIVTKKPSSTFEAFAEGLVAEDDEYQLRASVSGPISDNLGFRASGAYRTRDGHLTNVFDGSDINGSESYALRGKLLWDVSDRVDIQLIGDYNESDANCCQWTIVSTQNPVFAEELLPVVPGPENTEVNVNGPVRNDSTQWGVSAELNVDMGGSTLTSVTAFRKWENIGANDVDSVPIADARLGRLRFDQVGISETETFTQELRIASNDAGFLEYVGGIFIYDANIFRRLDRDLLACVAPGATPEGCGLPFPLQGFFETNVDVTNFAAFGQFDFNLTDQLTVILGGRALVEDVSFDFIRFGNISGGPAGPFNDSTSDTDVSLKAGLASTVSASIGWLASSAS